MRRGLGETVFKELIIEHERNISVLELWLVTQGYMAIMSKKWLKEIVRQLSQINNGMIPLKNEIIFKFISQQSHLNRFCPMNMQ
jgi:hypothetical protein